VTRAEVERDPIAYIQHVDGVLAATSQQVADFREEVSREFVSVRTEIARVDEKLSQFRTETQAEFATTRSEIADLRTEMRGELTDLRTEMRGELADLRTEMRGELTEVKAAIVQVLARLPQPPSSTNDRGPLA